MRMLAGLPPVVGLYASILPLVAYALFGTSRTLAVGPVAVISLMTATAAGAVATPGSAEYIAAALALALLSGLMLLVMGVLRLGFLANLLSPSGDLGLHHRLGPPDRGRPAQAHARHRGRRPQPARDASGRSAGQLGADQPADPGDRRRGDVLPVLGRARG